MLFGRNSYVTLRFSIVVPGNKPNRVTVY